MNFGSEDDEDIYSGLPVTIAQRYWLRKYEHYTMLEPLYLEELGEGGLGFDYVARENIRHFEDFAAQTMSFISSNVPYKELEQE